MLRRQQEILAGYPERDRARTLLIVCDDASAEDPAHEAAVEPSGYELQVYRIHGEKRPWTHIRPRNLGVHVAPPGWLIVTDIDHTVPPETADFLFSMGEPTIGEYYTFARRMPDGSQTNPHANSFLLEKEWFWQDVGGIDESFSGFYGVDSLFRARAARCGKCVHLPAAHLVVWNRDGRDIGDVRGAATNLPRKGGPYHARSNPAVKRRLQLAMGKRPVKTMAFEYERVL